MNRSFFGMILLPALWAHSVHAAGSDSTWVSPCTLDVVLVTFQDTTDFIVRRDSTANYDYHEHDLPFGYTAPGVPSSTP